MDVATSTVRVLHRIAGAPVNGSGQRTSPIHDPATGSTLAHVGLADEKTVDRAVQAAADAYPSWRETSLSRRTAILFHMREALATRVEELADIVTAEHGKVVDDAVGEVRRGLEVLEFACGIPHLLKGGFSEEVSTRVDAYSIRQPLGVAGVISPFNFPVMVPMWFAPIAIACGNTVVLKPSEKDPSAANWLADLWSDHGLPPGVFNVIHGDGDAVNHLLAHPDVASISFVGSTPVARHVYEMAAAHGKRVQALGGAKNHMIVMPDADLDAAADAAVSAGYGSAGERCMAISVVVAVEPVADELIARIRARTAELRVGDGRAGCDMGPLITSDHRDRVASYLDRAEQEGAKVLIDGRETAVHGDPGGYWLGPCLVDDVAPSMAVYRDEIFGPVLAVVRVASLDDAIDLVNANPYGNGTAIFTRDGGSARRFQHEVEVGMVGINVPIPVPMAYHSFGGWKASLFGDTHAHGPHGIHFFTRTKAVTARWFPPSATARSLAFPVGG